MLSKYLIPNFNFVLADSGLKYVSPNLTLSRKSFFDLQCLGIFVTFSISKYVALQMRKIVLVLLRSNNRIFKFECDNCSSNTLALFTSYKHEY